MNLITYLNNLPMNHPDLKKQTKQPCPSHLYVRKLSNNLASCNLQHQASDFQGLQEIHLNLHWRAKHFHPNILVQTKMCQDWPKIILDLQKALIVFLLIVSALEQFPHFYALSPEVTVHKANFKKEQFPRKLFAEIRYFSKLFVFIGSFWILMQLQKLPNNLAFCNLHQASNFQGLQEIHLNLHWRAKHFHPNILVQTKMCQDCYRQKRQKSIF